MALNVSCPDCGKRFENIKPELAGKKAKCSCGRVIRLGEKDSGSQGRNNPDPEDLMSVDLLGDELLGDQLLGGQLISASSEAIVTPRVPQAKPKPVTTGPKKESASRESNKARRTINEEVPVVSIVNSPTKKRPKKRPARNSNKPVYADAFDDLDSILEGVGDASPIVPRPDSSQQRPQIENATSESDSSAKSSKGSTIGLVAALMSATLAFWFGVFAVVSRFEVVDQMLLGGFSATLNSVYLASFGDLEVPPGIPSMFVGLGWAFWSVTLLLMIFGAAQFLNAFFKLVVGRHFFSWCDGLTAGLGVAALFLVVCLIFTQTSLKRHQHKFFDDYEKSAVADGGHLENVVVIRAEFDRQQSVIQNWLIFAAVVPTAVFGLSMVRLFASTGERID